MQVQNPFTKLYIEYPIQFEPEKLNYHIRHETPFDSRYLEWAVSVMSNGDVIYMPYGQNRGRYIYIVTRFYINKEVVFPRGIYTIPMSYFTKSATLDEEYEAYCRSCNM